MTASKRGGSEEELYAEGAVAALPDQVPVLMPDLPVSLDITTEQQLKALGDPVRSRILGIIQNQPATAKQIADRLGSSPGAVGHHLQVLEEAGLAQVVARRVVRGIVAKYYTRTARIFNFKLPKDIRGKTMVSFDLMTHVRDELMEAEAALPDMTPEEEETLPFSSGFPHARISEERARDYYRRLLELVEEFMREPVNLDGQVYGFGYAFFVAPPYLQAAAQDEGADAERNHPDATVSQHRDGARRGRKDDA